MEEDVSDEQNISLEHCSVAHSRLFALFSARLPTQIPLLAWWLSATSTLRSVSVLRMRKMTSRQRRRRAEVKV